MRRFQEPPKLEIATRYNSSAPPSSSTGTDIISRGAGPRRTQNFGTSGTFRIPPGNSIQSEDTQGTNQDFEGDFDLSWALAQMFQFTRIATLFRVPNRSYTIRKQFYGLRLFTLAAFPRATLFFCLEFCPWFFLSKVQDLYGERVNDRVFQFGWTLVNTKNKTLKWWRKF